VNSSFVYSLLAHFLIGLLLFVSIPSWKSDTPVNESAVLWVDLNKVELSQKTNLPSQKKTVSPAVPKKEQPAAPVKQPIKKTQPSKPAEPVQKHIKQADSVPVVENKTKQKPQPPKIKQKPKTPQKPKKTAPKPVKKEEPDDGLDSLFSSVDQISKSDAMQQAKEKSEMSNVVDSVLDDFAGTSSFDGQEKISVSMIDYISSVVRQNWRLDAGIDGIETMIVVLEVTLSADGRVASVQIIEDVARMQTDSTYKAVAEGVKRAVYICDKLDESPFVQLAQKYPASFRQWQKLKLRFNPTDL